MFSDDILNSLTKHGRNAPFSREQYVCFGKFNEFSSSKTSINDEGHEMSRNVKLKNGRKVNRARVNLLLSI